MPCCEWRAAIEGTSGTGCISVIVDWRMSRFVWLTGPITKALIGISAAGIQHGEPGERREVHWRKTLTCIADKSLRDLSAILTRTTQILSTRPHAPHDPTTPRPHAPTSLRPYVPTSLRPYVPTSPRLHVSTSLRFSPVAPSRFVVISKDGSNSTLGG
jgi:hypothetical protein